MRSDAEPFRSRNAATVKYPRIVVKIEFDVESIFLTSHTGIKDIPGVIIEGVVQEPNATSQKIVPDEARSEIGAFSFTLIDKDEAFTDAIRTRLLDDGYGLRGKKVRLYIGYAVAVPVSETSGTAFGAGPYGSGPFGGASVSYPDVAFECSFDDFGLFQTQVITGVQYDAGVYHIQCKDITREQREDIFEPKVTNLAQELAAGVTTVEVYDTSDFHPIAHGTSYSDSPSATVGYIKIDKEIIKYTGKTASSFTGCTRGALNTKDVPHTFESTVDQGRRPKVEEYIYLEEPCVKLAYKVLTGRDPLTGVTCWPPHWHLGISPSLVRVADFTGIDDDLWDTTDDTVGVVGYFEGLKKVTGKRFLESEIYMLLGCYQRVYADGTIGLKRMNHVLADSASVVTLDEDNCVSWSELNHEYGKMHNRIRIDWNWNGEEFTRTTLYIDETSIALHGSAPVKTYQFKGLHGSRHTDAIIRKRLDAIRDRYSQPPETISVSVLPSLNVLEMGDIARVQLSTVRDFAAEGDHIDRSFEIQQGSYDWGRGVVSFDLFGSTARAETTATTTDTSSLPSAFYTDRGTNLTSVCTIVVTGGVGVIQPGSYTLNGHADVNDSSAIYYYNGDLQLAAGATLVINDNVQIRHNGFFQINGAIDGVGNGKAGVADTGSHPSTTAGTPGFVGNTRGMDGVLSVLPTGRKQNPYLDTVPCALTEGQYSAFPYLDLTVSGNDILGIPSDLRGTSGGGGGKSATDFMGTATTLAVGGTGGNSGAGLVLVGKGVAFGGAGSIDLSGDNGTAGSLTLDAYSGAGAGGGPGALLILIDGGSVSLPDVSGSFTALTGTTPILGEPLPERTGNSAIGLQTPIAGFLDPSYISDVNLSNAAYRIQYLPAVQTPQEDSQKPAAATALSAVGSIGKITLSATIADLQPGEVLEFYSASSNDRTLATRVGYGAQSVFVHDVATGATRYYWTRVRRVQPGVDLFSEWFPVSATGGLAASTSTVTTTDIAANAATETYSSSSKPDSTISTQDTGGDPSNWTATTSAGTVTITGGYPYNVVVIATLAITARYNSAGATPEWFWNIQTAYTSVPFNAQQEYGVIQPIAGELSEEAYCFRAIFSVPADARTFVVQGGITKGDGADAGDVLIANTRLLTVEVIKK